MDIQKYKFELIPLPYDYNAMEPYIDTLTMQLHHDRHLKTYVDNLNKILENYPEYQNWSLEKLIYNANRLPSVIANDVKNNAGGVYNHNLYFYLLSPQHNTLPTGELKDRIEKDFGNFDSFKEEFKKQALSVFGSGYAWLVLNKFGRLKLIKTANQDTPLAQNLCPILLADVWEHAYYLKHYNKRADYIDDWFHVVNWETANSHYNQCKVILSIKRQIRF